MKWKKITGERTWAAKVLGYYQYLFVEQYAFSRFKAVVDDKSFQLKAATLKEA
jgi:hypothetical protein